MQFAKDNTYKLVDQEKDIGQLKTEMQSVKEQAKT